MPAMETRTTLAAALAAILIATAPVARAAPALAAERLAFDAGAVAAQPSLAVDPREGFVLTWQEKRDAASALRYAVIGRDGAELRRGLVSEGPDRFVNGADFPNLAVLDNGDWVTFWLQKTAKGTYAYEIRSVRSRDAGRTWEPPIVIHRDGTPTEHGFVSMVPAGGDRVRLVWLDGRRMAASADAHGEGADEHMTLRTAVLARDGAPRDEHELDALTCACCQTDLVRTGDGALAAYRDRTPGEIRDIAVAAFDGKAWSAPARAHADEWRMPACPVNGPALAARGGRVALTWPTMASGEMRVAFALRDGAGFAGPAVLAEGPAELGRVDLAAYGEGWLASRVANVDGVPTLRVAAVDDRGHASTTLDVATRVGGYPRLARDGDVALIAWTESAGAPGATRIGLARIAGR